MKNYFETPNPEVMVDVLISQAYFQSPGHVDESFLYDVAGFLNFVQSIEHEIELEGYSLMSKTPAEYTGADLEAIEQALERVARYYESKDF